MKKALFCFPAVLGTAYYYNGLSAVSFVSNDGNINVVSDKKQIKKSKILDVWFVRGVYFFFFGLYLLFKFLTLSLKYSQHYSKPLSIETKITKKTKIQPKYITLTIIGLITFFASFVMLNLLPSLFVRWIGTSASDFGKGVLTGVFKIIFFYAMLLSLKLIPAMKSYYQFNGAVNKCAQTDAYSEITNKNIKDKSIYFSQNYLTICVFGFVFDFFVVSFIPSGIGFGFLFLSCVLVLVLSMSIAYEIMLLAKMQKNLFTKIFVLIFSFPTSCVPSASEEEASIAGYNEIMLMIKNTNREKLFKIDGKSAVSAIKAEVASALSLAGIDDPSEADWLIATVLEKNRAELGLVTYITEQQREKIREVLKRRVNHEPLSKIFGFAEFYGRRFYVDKNVLSPRMETEEVVCEAIKIIKSKKISSALDLCSGSGCIAVTIAKETGIEVTGADISRSALKVASKNAKNLEANVAFVESDMFNGLKKKNKFDIIISNPPYLETKELKLIPKEVRDYDPILALDGGNNGMYFYERIARDAPEYLADGGYLVLEISYSKAQETIKLLQTNFCQIKLLRDAFGNDRIITAKLKGKTK